jgi:hypothetical protein
MQMFATSEKEEPHIDDITGLSLAAVMRMTVQVARQPL